MGSKFDEDVSSATFSGGTSCANVEFFGAAGVSDSVGVSPSGFAGSTIIKDSSSANLTALIEQLHSGNFSCVIASGSDVRTFSGKGVTDLRQLLHSSPAYLNGAAVADKVVGIAAAAIAVAGGVATVYADVISAGALRLLVAGGVAVSYDKLVTNIANRSGSGVCPLELACSGAAGVTEILANVENFFAGDVKKIC